PCGCERRSAPAAFWGMRWYAGGWYVVPAHGVQTTLPRRRLRVEALSGPETARATQEIDLRTTMPAEGAVRLDFLFRPEEEQLAAGNTHLQLSLPQHRLAAAPQHGHGLVPLRFFARLRPGGGRTDGHELAPGAEGGARCRDQRPAAAPERGRQ